MPHIAHSWAILVYDRHACVWHVVDSADESTGWTRPLRTCCAADLRVGDGTRFRTFTRQTREFMRAKIQALFRFARLASARHLILGALGCGAFGCPASEVMPLFREAIAEHGRAFERIDFAILPHRDILPQFRALETR